MPRMIQSNNEFHMGPLQHSSLGQWLPTSFVVTQAYAPYFWSYIRRFPGCQLEMVGYSLFNVDHGASIDRSKRRPRIIGLLSHCFFLSEYFRGMVQMVLQSRHDD